MTVLEPSHDGGDDRPPAGESIEVLLVDDDEAWAASTAQVLEHQREAFTVTTATDLASASDAFATDPPDCVVCDYDLGTETGLDLLADIREADDDRPFILITGQGSESLASTAIGQEVTDYIPKRSLGGRADLLARRVESAVSSYRTRRALARERRSKEAMLDILTATSSRRGLAAEFCEHLVRERDYDCAWVGTVDGSGGVVPLGVAGAESYVDRAVDPGTPPGEGSEPALRALAEREQVVVSIEQPDAPADGTHTDDDGGSHAGDDATADSTATAPSGAGDAAAWRSVAATQGFGSAAAVPLEHEKTVLGVLAVYDTAPAVGSRERELLAEYGEKIGYALRSAEWRESLLSPSSVAVEITVTDPAAPLVALDGGLPTDARTALLTTAPRDGKLLHVLRVTGATAATVRTAAADVAAVERVTVTDEAEPVRCELLVTRPTPESLLADHGGRILDTTVERGRATVTAVSADGTDAQSLVGAVRQVYPDAGVRSVRSTDATAGAESTTDIVESLTEKQRRAVEMAYYSGYFERPREHNTTEVAEKLGISRQTLTQHLRAGERKLLSGLLEPEEE